MTEVRRPVSAAVEVDLARTVTKPGFLVLIRFPSIFYASSRGDVTWNGVVWPAYGLSVSGFDVDSSRASTGGRLVINDQLEVLTNLILTHGAAEREVVIYQISSDTPGDEDPVFYFKGRVDEVEIDVDARTVSVSCATGMASWYSPRMYVDAASGFTWKPPLDPRFGALSLRWFNSQIITFKQAMT